MSTMSVEVDVEHKPKPLPSDPYEQYVVLLKERYAPGWIYREHLGVHSDPEQFEWVD